MRKKSLYIYALALSAFSTSASAMDDATARKIALQIKSEWEKSITLPMIASCGENLWEIYKFSVGNINVDAVKTQSIMSPYSVTITFQGTLFYNQKSAYADGFESPSFLDSGAIICFKSLKSALSHIAPSDFSEFNGQYYGTGVFSFAYDLTDDGWEMSSANQMGRNAVWPALSRPENARAWGRTIRGTMAGQ